MHTALGGTSQESKRILLTGNTAFKLANFREGLIRRLLYHGHNVTVVAPPDDHVEKILALGCEFEPIQMDRNGTSIFSEARLLYAIFAAIRQKNPDIVFSYTIKNNIYGGIVCRWLGIPFVPNVTGLGPTFNTNGPLNRIIKLFYGFAFSKAKTVFFQNSSDLEFFAESGLVPKERVRLLPGSGVDLNRFAMTPRVDNDDSVRFILIARLLWDKGIGIYAGAARKVREAFPKAEFQLLGPLDPDSLSSINQTQLDEWKAEGALNYLGTTQDVVPFLRAAHCFVLPSYYREGTPRSILEAGAVGLPIITTDLPGCRDTVIHNETGFLVVPHDSNDLAQACKRFIEMTPITRANMGQASRRHIEKNYDEEIVIDAYLGMLK